jgi:hypothetical protein
VPESQLLFDFAIPEAVSVPERSVVAEVSAPFVERVADVAALSTRRGRMQLLRENARAAERGGAATIAGLRRPRNPRGVDHARPVQQRYDRVVDEMIAAYGLHVRCWRNSLSGLATLRLHRDGRLERWIESPYPTSPLRMAIFLHEVGHHAIGLGIHRPRCLEEYLAWRWAIDRMETMGMPTDGTVARRFERAMRYAVSKSLGRGIRALPAEVRVFVTAA